MPQSFCPHYQATAPDVVKNGKRTSTIKLLDISGIPAKLVLAKQRYFCKRCMKSSTASSTGIVKPHCFISKRVKLSIQDALHSLNNETEIAKKHRVSIHTVRRIVQKTGDLLDNRRLFRLAEHLSFDEFKSTRSASGAMSFICIDAVTHQVIDIVENCRLHLLKNDFLRYPLKERLRVKTITIDRYSPYIELIHSVFPNAILILDKFHLIQMATRELNKIRVHVMNSFRFSNIPLYNKYKRYWKLLLKNPDTLQNSKLSYMKLFSYWTSQQRIVSYLLNQSDELKETYNLVHDTSDALRNNDVYAFKQAINALPHSLYPKLRYIGKSYERNLPYIKNMLDAPHLTNGPIEGINNKIKVLKRNAVGYRNFNHFRHRIL